MHVDSGHACGQWACMCRPLTSAKWPVTAAAAAMIGYLLTYLITYLLTYVRQMASDRSGGRHDRRDEMGASSLALAALKVTVGGGGASLMHLQLVGVHREAH